MKGKERLVPQPLFPYISPVQITEDKFGTVPRVYIKTLKDKALSIDAQRSMYAATPCRQVMTIDSDHSPFYSQTDALVSHLKSLGS